MEKGNKIVNSRNESALSGVRRHPRFDVELPVDYQQIDSSSRHIGWGSNLSEKGILLHLTEEIEVGQFLNVKLYFASGTRLHSIQLLSHIIWREIRTEKGQRNYCYGVHFIRISSRGLRRLKSFLKSLSLQPTYTFRNVVSCLRKNLNN